MPLYGLLLGTFLVAVLMVCIKAEDTCSGNEESPFYKLHKAVFCDYDSAVRPVRDADKAVNVSIGFLVRYLSMEEHENLLNVHTMVELTWKDEFIKWKPEDYGGVNFTVVGSSQIWTPDLQVYNDRYFYAGRSELYINQVHVYYTGLVYAVAQGEMAAHCNMDIYTWPFDSHTCKAIIGSTNYHGGQMFLNFGNTKLRMDLYMNSSVWELEDVVVNKTVFFYPMGKNGTKIPYVKFYKYFYIRRFSSALFSSVAMPILACVFLTLVSYWLDPQDMTRMVCILITLIGHISFLQFLANHLPPNAVRGVLVIDLLRDSLIITLITFIMSSINRHLQTLQTTPPLFINQLLSKLATNGPAKFLLMSEDDQGTTSDDEVSLVKTPSKFKREWLQISCLIDRTLFFLFLFIYFVLFLSYSFS